LPQFDRGEGPAIPQLIDDIRAQIGDAEVRALPRRLGSINQIVACRDLEDDAGPWRARVAALFRA
jgi:hypothetical protein